VELLSEKLPFGFSNAKYSETDFIGKSPRVGSETAQLVKLLRIEVISDIASAFTITLESKINIRNVLVINL
jgi:hypothetical protein